MRLFRKSKAGQGSADIDASKQSETHQLSHNEQPEASPLPPPQPPPVLRLDFEFPLAQSTNTAPSSETAGAPSVENLGLQQQRQQQYDRPTPAQETRATTSMGDSPGGGLLGESLIASDIQRIAAAYNFDYPFQVAEDSSPSQTEEESIQRQLAEQFGFGPKAHRAIPQSQPPVLQSSVSYTPHHAPSAPASHVASNSSSNSASSLKHQQLARAVMHNMQMAAANRTTIINTPIKQMSMSHSSNGSSSVSSEDEGGVPKLNSSMTAMSLSGGAPPATNAAVGKLSDRAQHIQKVREASALGKVVAFSKTTNSAGGAATNSNGCDDSDDADDMVPLGGLKKAGNSSVPNILAADRNGAQASMASQHAVTHGQNFPSPVVYDNGEGVAKHFAPQHALSMHNLQQQQQQQQQQQLYQYPQHQQTMHSPSAASVTSQMSAPIVMRRATIQQPGPGAGLNQHMYPGCSPQQMAYPRSKAVAGGIGSAYSHVGYSRAPAMPDPSLHAYTPSPLGQVPVYSQPAAATHQQMLPADMHMAHYPPPMMSHAGMPMASQQQYYQRAQPCLVPQQQQLPQQFAPQHFQPSQQPPQQLLQSQPQPQHQPQPQQPQQQCPVGQHPAALTSFIPTQLACRGSLAKNPLMRDINKLKSFSAKDYTARPTLLAEVDSRQQAKKNMPGLGGTTSHSYQPEVPPPIQQQPQPPMPEPQHQQYQPFRPHDQADYRDPADHYPRSNIYEAPYHSRSRSCRIFDDEENDYSSVSSRTSGQRYHGVRRSGASGPMRRHRYDHVDNTYGSEYGERLRHRELRQMAPPPSSHSRRMLEQRRQPHRSNRYYDHHEHYDYEERSERYARDYYNDFDDYEEFDERYSDHYDHRRASSGLARRRDAQRRPRASDVRVGCTTRGEVGWASSYSTRGMNHGRHGYHSRPRVVRLDDPRDGDSIIFRSSPAPSGKGDSSDSESLLVLEHGKPRSQFGRILATLKRQTTGFAPLSPKATVHRVQMREAKVAGAQRVVNGRIVEVKSEHGDNGETESVPASALPENDEIAGAVDVASAPPAPPAEHAEQDPSEQLLKAVVTTDAIAEDGNEAETPPVPVAAGVVKVAAT